MVSVNCNDADLYDKVSYVVYEGSSALFFMSKQLDRAELKLDILMQKWFVSAMA